MGKTSLLLWPHSPSAEQIYTSLGPRPSPLRDLLRAFNCAGEGNIENVEGLG